MFRKTTINICGVGIDLDKIETPALYSTYGKFPSIGQNKLYRWIKEIEKNKKLKLKFSYRLEFMKIEYVNNRIQKYRVKRSYSWKINFNKYKVVAYTKMIYFAQVLSLRRNCYRNKSQHKYLNFLRQPNKSYSHPTLIYSWDDTKCWKGAGHGIDSNHL